MSRPASDLTTTRAPFIEGARSRGELFIQQPNELYSEDNHEAWQRLYQRMQPRWSRYAVPEFLGGLDLLGLDGNAVPRLDDVNRRLAPMSGFAAKAVSGYVPPFLFFDCLERREFPTTITIRDTRSLDYLPEPDIFHDVAGHVPMHTDPVFADVLASFGGVARRAGQRAAALGDGDARVRLVDSNVRAMARFFWFTIEFGLMACDDGLRAYGSGLLSSFAELEHCIESDEVDRRRFDLGEVVNQEFEIDRFQPLLYVVDSFAQLFAEVERLEGWLEAGLLDDVAPGEPGLDLDDLRLFLDAAA